MSTPTAPAAALARSSGIANGLLVGIMIVLETIDGLFRDALNWLGVRSWDFGGLWTLLTAPFIHRDFAHLGANAIPLLVLGFVIALGGMRRWAYVTLASAIGSGLFAFILNRPGTITIGASGIVFGYLTYLLTRGFFSRDWRQIAIGVVVLIVYGSVLWGVFPTEAGVSWQGHLGGAVAGVLVASWLHARSRRQK